MEWKWSNGKPYERTRRLKHIEEIENKEFVKDIETAAYTTSLYHDENTWDFLNQKFHQTDFKVSNKREELDLKISDRDLVQQIGYNPFLSDTNYLEDITMRDKFLKPLNTSSEDNKVNKVNN